jgi:hypothetical protein
MENVTRMQFFYGITLIVSVIFIIVEPSKLMTLVLVISAFMFGLKSIEK